MGKDKRKIRQMKFFKYVVKKPVICVMFFAAFFISLIFMFCVIEVPVYKEYEMKSVSDKKLILESKDDIELIEGSTIVYYKDRNTYIYTSDDYDVEKNTIEIKDSDVQMDGTVYVSGEIEMKSLGQYILEGSFNY